MKPRRQKAENRLTKKDQASTDETWGKIVATVETELRPESFQRWFKDIRCVSITEDEIVIGCPNSIYEFWIASNYSSLIRSAATFVLGSERVLRFVSAQDSSKKFDRTQNKSEALTTPLNPKNTFDSFVVGPNNEIGYAASRAVAQSARTYNPLFIYGGAGLGKTHLLQAIGLHALGERPTCHIAYVSSETFSNDFVTAIQTNTLVDFRRRYRQPDLLLIDDIHFLGDTGRTQEEFFHTFNALFDGHKQIVLSSDRAPSEIPKLENRLVSRFEWGLTAELQAPDTETRLAILRTKAHAARIDMPEDILTYVAKHIRTNVRRLEGALLRIFGFMSLHNGRPPTVDNLEHLLKDILSFESQGSVRLEEIQRMVAGHYDIRLADMSSNRRARNIAFPRQLAMYLSRELNNGSLFDIGQAFGGKAPSSILHACKAVRRRMQQDAQLRRTIDFLDRRLHQP